MRKELDFWKNRVAELEEECAEKQNDIDGLESDNENLKNEIEELKYILDSKEKIYMMSLLRKVLLILNLKRYMKYNKNIYFLS